MRACRTFSDHANPKIGVAIINEPQPNRVSIAYWGAIISIERLEEAETRSLTGRNIALSEGCVSVRRSMTLQTSVASSLRNVLCSNGMQPDFRRGALPGMYSRAAGTEVDAEEAEEEGVEARLAQVSPLPGLCH